MNPLLRLREKMAAENVAAVLVTDITNVGWLTGFSGSAGVVLVTANTCQFITDSRYTAQAQSEVQGAEVISFASPRTLNQVLHEVLVAAGVPIGFESHQVTVATLDDWKNKWSGVELHALKDFVSPLRMIKSAEEIEKVRRACGLADACFTHVQRVIQDGVSEYDVMLEIELFMRRQGAKAAFDIIVASGPRGALPHGRATERIMHRGEMVTLDFGATLDGYHSDITRTVSIGTPSDRMREVYDWVLKAQLASLEAMKPGVKASDVDGVARRVLAEKGLDVYFGHGLGHGLGRLVHDAGRLAATSADTLEVGQIWTVEPGVYLDGVGGVRIEDDVVVTADGIDILTHSTKELIELP